MTQIDELITHLQLAREKTLALLDKIERDSGDEQEILGWRPGPGRAHIAWQIMHVAATDDDYLNTRILQGSPRDPDLFERYAKGSTPADAQIPTLDEIRTALATHREHVVAFFRNLDPAKVDEKPHADAQRTHRGAAQLLAWHEGHHHGQAHLTLNLFHASR